jgi:hypothetical protein
MFSFRNNNTELFVSESPKKIASYKLMSTRILLNSSTSSLPVTLRINLNVEES